MGAPELLHYLRGVGLVLKLTPVGALHVAPRSVLTDDHRAAIRAERDALVMALQSEGEQPPPPTRSCNPLMTPEQGDECHDGGWCDAEIDAFLAREARFARLGRSAEAEHLAERLTLRDRQLDERRLCLECAALADTGRCLVAGYGRMKDVSNRTEPVPIILKRCIGFTLAPGLV